MKTMTIARTCASRSDAAHPASPRTRRLVMHSGLALLLAVAGNAALAQAHTHESGEYVLRSSVVRSTSIAESTAREHGIEPAPGTGVLNVLVMKKKGQQREPVAAEVEAEIRNLLGASHSVDLKEVRSNGRVSYVSSFAYAPAETLDFHISAKPRAGGPQLELDFRESMGLAGGQQ